MGLTKPELGDAQKAFTNTLNTLETTLGSDDKTTKAIRDQGVHPDMDVWRSRIFHERFDNISQAEGEAILFYLEAFNKEHGENYGMSNDLKLAIDRHWEKYRADVSHYSVSLMH